MDFDLTNIKEHPSDDRFLVFLVKNQGQARYFTQLLQEEGIRFEYFEEEDSGRIFFGIEKRYSARAKYLNNLAIGKFRNPFIPFKGLRMAILLITFLMLLAAAIGFMVSE